MSQFETRGVWWIAGQRDHRTVSGLLTVDGGTIELVLDEGTPLLAHFEPGGKGWSVYAHPATAAAIHGLCQGQRKVTLLRPASHAGPISAGAVVEGAWLKPSDDEQLPPEEVACFAEIEVELEHLRTFSADSSLQRRSTFGGQPEPEALALLMDPPDHMMTTADGTSFSLSWTTTSRKFFGRGEGGVRLSDKVALRIAPAAPECIQALLKRLAPIPELVGMAAGREARVIALRLVPADDAPQVPVRLYMPWPVGDSAAPAVNGRDMVFTLADIDFTALLARWYDVHDDLRGVLFALVNARDVEAPPETRLVSAATAAENLHRVLNAGSTAIPKAEFTQLKKTLTGALRDSGASDDQLAWLRAVLQNTPSLQQRLRQLADELGEHANSVLFQQYTDSTAEQHREAWLWATRKGRNDIAHTGVSKTVDDKALLTAARATVALVELRLLRHLGFDDTHLARVAGRRHVFVAEAVRHDLLPAYLAMSSGGDPIHP